MSKYCGKPFFLIKAYLCEKTPRKSVKPFSFRSWAVEKKKWPVENLLGSVERVWKGCGGDGENHGEK